MLDRRKFVKTSLLYSFGGLGVYSGLNLIPSSPKGMKKLPGGFWPVMMTPYTKDRKIDYPALERLIGWYEDAGSTGLFPNCGSSEMYQLSPEERIDLTKFVVEHSRLPVVSTGTFSGDQKEDSEFIKQIYDTGVEAVVVIPAIMVPREADDHALLSAFDGLLENTGNIPLGVYECPGPYHRLIPPAMLGELQESERFLYFKDTSCDAAVVDRKIEAVGSSSMGIYNAHSPDVLHSIRHGGAGISCIAGNFYPELFSYLWKYGRSKKVSDSVRKVNEFILTNDSVIGNKYPLAAKYFMNIRGLDLSVNSRKNTAPLEQADKEKLDKLWGELLHLSEEVDVEIISYA